MATEQDYISLKIEELKAQLNEVVEIKNQFTEKVKPVINDEIGDKINELKNQLKDVLPISPTFNESMKYYEKKIEEKTAIVDYVIDNLIDQKQSGAEELIITYIENEYKKLNSELKELREKMLKHTQEYIKSL